MYRSIGTNFGHQVALLALVTSLATRWRHMHCHIALLTSSVGIEVLSSSARVTSVKSQKGLFVCELDFVYFSLIGLLLPSFNVVKWRRLLGKKISQRWKDNNGTKGAKAAGEKFNIITLSRKVLNITIFLKIFQRVSALSRNYLNELTPLICQCSKEYSLQYHKLDRTLKR